MKLPPSDLKRWSPHKKFAVVLAVLNKKIGHEEAARHYGLSSEELEIWIRNATAYGMRGLSVTKMQEYRRLGGAKC